MRRRTLLEDKNSGNGVVDGSKATPMSVVFANKNDGSLTIVEGDKWSASSYPASTFTPIGIVVIPGEHGVLKDADRRNQCGIISLVPMNCTTPTSGGTSEQRMYWGDADTDISTLTNYNKVVVTSGNSSNAATGLSSDYYAYIPRQGSVGATPTRSSSPYAPSPYAGSDYKSGGYNESYGTTKFDTESDKNALSDFDGPGNTKKIIEARGPKDYSSWKPNSSSPNDYPAASCCDMFSTVGTKQGDWYLPACGELGYIIPRLYDINDTIDKLNKAYGVGVQLNTISNFWSSSEYSSKQACYVYMYNGYVHYINYKSNGNYVRAFLRL